LPLHGPPICHQFEKEVLDNLILDVSGKDINITYTHHVVQEVAKELQKQECWKDHPLVKDKNFSPKWVFGFLDRQGMQKRRITTDFKPTPDQLTIDTTITSIQTAIMKGGFDLDHILNMDETACVIGEGPRFLYVDKK
jgi:hypothetical protein